jgi:hypothetical protein
MCGTDNSERSSAPEKSGMLQIKRQFMGARTIEELEGSKDESDGIFYSSKRAKSPTET